MPRCAQDFSPLDFNGFEASTFTFDFVNLLGVGETISTTSWTVNALNGKDLTPANRLVGSASTLGTKTLQRIGNGGVVGEVYQIISTITTSAGQTLTLYAHCPCIALS